MNIYQKFWIIILLLFIIQITYAEEKTKTLSTIYPIDNENISSQNEQYIYFNNGLNTYFTPSNKNTDSDFYIMINKYRNPWEIGLEFGFFNFEPLVIAVGFYNLLELPIDYTHKVKDEYDVEGGFPWESTRVGFHQTGIGYVFRFGYLLGSSKLAIIPNITAGLRIEYMRQRHDG